jgi:hypothetical protein
MWPFEPSKKPQIVFSPAAGCLKNVYVAICNLKKNQIFFACGELSEKYVYGHLVRSKVLDRVFLLRKKKCIFHLCLIVCPILFCPLILCLLVQSFDICSFSGGQRTRDKSADFLSASGGTMLPLILFFLWKTNKYPKQAKIKKNIC